MNDECAYCHESVNREQPNNQSKIILLYNCATDEQEMVCSTMCAQRFFEDEIW